MANFSTFGNDLYTGKLSFNIIGRRRIFFGIAIVLVLASLLLPLIRPFTFGIEFTGGTEFDVNSVSTQKQSIATDIVRDELGKEARVTSLGTNGVRVQTDPLSDDDTRKVQQKLADGYGTSTDHVSTSLVGPSWGADITGQAIRGLIIFVLLAAIVMAIYFRTWKMSLAAILSLLHDLVLVAGVYCVSGFEVTPAAVIGFLTILGYSLYDTVVVFDKIRENTGPTGVGDRYTFAGAVNLAVNQTLVRSINTSIVAILPVASILFIGAFIGAGTLRDIALALFVGIIVGTYSTIFIAAPLYVTFRQREPKIRERDARALEAERKRSSVAEAEPVEA